MARKKQKRTGTGGSFQRLVLRTSVRFNYVLFPLDLRDFLDILNSLQFAPLGQLPPEPTAVGPEAKLAGQGPVARKGDLTVDINTEKQFFGISGPKDAKATLAALVEILDHLKQVFDPVQVAFYELQARYRAVAPSSPMAAIARLGKNTRITKDAAKAFGMPMDLFSARLIAGPRGPNDPNYLEVWLQPVGSLPEKELGISVIFRDASLEKFSKVSVDLEDSLTRFLDSIYRGT